MKVLLAHCSYRVPGGEDTYVEGLHRLLSIDDDPVLVRLRNADLSSNLDAAKRMLFSRATLRQMRQVLATTKPDVVHVHNIYPAIGPAIHLAARNARVPLVMTVHNFRLRCPNGLMFTEGSPCHRCQNGAYHNAVIHECFPSRRQAAVYAASTWAHRYLFRLEESVSKFIAPSKFMLERMMEWGISQSKVAYVRNFTDEQPPANQRSKGAYLGRLSTEKGLQVLLEALRIIGDPPFRIIGDGPDRVVLEARAQSLGLRHLAFVGRQEGASLAAIMDDTRFLVVPSICEENSPLAAYEALTRRIPLVVSRIGGLGELVESGTGIGCTPGDPDALAEAIREIDKPDTYSARCRAAGDFARRELLPTDHLARVKNVYEEAVRTPPVPS